MGGRSRGVEKWGVLIPNLKYKKKVWGGGSGGWGRGTRVSEFFGGGVGG